MSDAPTYLADAARRPPSPRDALALSRDVGTPPRASTCWRVSSVSLRHVDADAKASLWSSRRVGRLPRSCACLRTRSGGGDGGEAAEVPTGREPVRPAALAA